MIDAAPPWLKDFAISTFGTHDKTALLSGILALLVVYSVVLGIVSLRRRFVGVGGVVAFGIIGIVAALTASSARAKWWGVLPTVVGTAFGAATIWYLAGLAQGDNAASNQATMGRRAFLFASAGIGAAAIVAGGAGSLVVEALRRGH